jgi:hypothetical protein
MEALPIVVVLAFAVLLFWPLAEAAFASARRTKVACPLSGRRVSVEFLERAAFGVVAAVDVRTCSAFPGEDEPDCGKACLRPVALPDVRTTASAHGRAELHTRGSTPR